MDQFDILQKVGVTKMEVYSGSPWGGAYEMQWETPRSSGILTGQTYIEVIGKLWAVLLFSGEPV